MGIYTKRYVQVIHTEVYIHIDTYINTHKEIKRMFRLNMGWLCLDVSLVRLVNLCTCKRNIIRALKKDWRLVWLFFPIWSTSHYRATATGPKTNKVNVWKWLQNPLITVLLRIEGRGEWWKRWPTNLTRLYYMLCQEEWVKIPANYCEKLVEGNLKCLNKVSQFKKFKKQFYKTLGK